MDRSDLGLPAVEEQWTGLLEDAEDIATAYREDGWDALVVHPGDVSVLAGETFGLAVLVPGNEFEELETAVGKTDFETSRVYATDDGAIRLYVIVVEAPGDTVAVVVPAFARRAEVASLRRRATEEGTMRTHVRPLSDDARVTFHHSEPELFFGQ